MVAWEGHRGFTFFLLLPWPGCAWLVGPESLTRDGAWSMTVSSRPNDWAFGDSQERLYFLKDTVY